MTLCWVIGSGKPALRTSRRNSLQFGVGQPESAPIKKTPKAPDPSQSRVAAELSPKGLWIDPTQLVRVVHRGLERPSLHLRREVDQRESRRGHRNTVVDGEVLPVKPAAVNPDSGPDPRALSKNRNMNLAWRLALGRIPLH